MGGLFVFPVSVFIIGRRRSPLQSLIYVGITSLFYLHTNGVKIGHVWHTWGNGISYYFEAKTLWQNILDAWTF